MLRHSNIPMRPRSTPPWQNLGAEDPSTQGGSPASHPSRHTRGCPLPDWVRVPTPYRGVSSLARENTLAMAHLDKL